MEEMKKEAEWLLTEKYWGIETDEYKKDLERLYQGEPLAYLIGSVPFLESTIYLDSRPLIPRPETEYWVEAAIHEIAKHKGRPTVLDLCAGSGCIGVAVLKALPKVYVDFEEINTLHHKTIRKNIIENSIELDRTSIIGGDLFERTTGHYDFILSNPPYIDPALDRAEQSVKDYEPHAALYGGEGGTELIAEIMHEAEAHLTKDGVIYLEHEPEHSERIQKLAEACSYEAATCKDQYGILRFTRLSRVS